MISQQLRHVAQWIRHRPALQGFSPLWRVLRWPYLQTLQMLVGRKGLEVKISGFPLRLHPHFATQNWETLEAASYQAFARHIHPQDVIFDVGAHIGTYTLIALKQTGARGRVVAYEPHPPTRQYLQQHLKWNDGKGQVLVRPVCCGARSGKTYFYFRPDEKCAEGRNSRVPVDGFSKATVSMVTLDQEMKRWRLIPHMIKIDVEGGEWEVLRGAEEILRKHRPILLLSLHPRELASWKTSPEEVLAWLRALRYQMQPLGSDHEIHVLAKPRSKRVA